MWSGISQQDLQERLAYDASTGVFTWRSESRCWGGRRVHVTPGQRAGTQRPNGYRLINIDGIPMLEHRLAWMYVYGEWPAGDIDHINGDRSDNRISNLRDVTRQVNLQNMRRPMANKKHGSLLGSAWHASTGKWRALIKSKGRQVSLGYFDTEQAAHDAYLAAKRRLHEGCTI